MFDSRLALVALITFFAFTAVAEGATRYADPAGASTADCSASSPCDISTAMAPAALHDGDEVIVNPGEYHATAPLTVTAAVTVRGSDPTNRPLIRTGGWSMFVNNDGADLTDLQVEYAGNTNSVDAGLTVQAADTLTRLTVIRYGDTGCNIQGASNVTIRDSVCYGYNVGVIATGQGILLENVTAMGALPATGKGIYVNGTVRMVNTIADGRSVDVALQGQSDSPTTLTATNSNYSTTYVQLWSEIDASGTQATEPSLDGNFHQQPGSPTIDAGVPTTSTLDFEGNPRPQGGGNDIGAHEATALPPETTAVSGPNGSTTDSTPSFEFTSPDAGATFECSVDQAEFTDCTSPLTTQPLINGPHSVAVRAVRFGLADPSPVVFEFTVEAVLPQTTITSAPAGLTADPAPSFGFVSSKDGTFECSLDGGSFAACASPFSTTLAEGRHTFSVRAIDLAGNREEAPAQAAFTIDLTAPVTRIAPPPAVSANPKVSISFDASEPASFRCSLDGTPFVDCVSPYGSPSLADGTHSLRVVATDLAGNVETDPAAVTFLIDTVAPKVTLRKKPARSTRSKIARFRFRVSEKATVTCKLDRKPARRCSGAVGYRKLKPGRHKVVFSATDQAGNSSRLTYVWKVKKPAAKRRAR